MRRCCRVHGLGLIRTSLAELDASSETRRTATANAGRRMGHRKCAWRECMDGCALSKTRSRTVVVLRPLRIVSGGGAPGQRVQ